MYFLLLHISDKIHPKSDRMSIQKNPRNKSGINFFKLFSLVPLVCNNLSGDVAGNYVVAGNVEFHRTKTLGHSSESDGVISDLGLGNCCMNNIYANPQESAYHLSTDDPESIPEKLCGVGNNNTDTLIATYKDEYNNTVYIVCINGTTTWNINDPENSTLATCDGTLVKVTKKVTTDGYTLVFRNGLQGLANFIFIMSGDVDDIEEYAKEHNIKYKTLRDGEVIIQQM